MRGDTKEFQEADSIKVMPIDIKKLTDDIIDFMLKEKIVKDKSYEVKPADNAILNVHNLTVRVDTECCWNVSTDHADGFAFDVFKTHPEEVDADGKKSWKVSMFPTTTIRMTADDLKEYLKPEVSIKEFMGDRFDYNSRIRGNMEYFFHYVKTGSER